MSKEQNYTFLCLLGILLTVSVPLTVDYCLAGECLTASLERIESVRESLAAGAWAAGGLGSRTAVFQSNLFLTIPALLRMAGVGAQNVWRVWLVALNLLTVGVSYAAFRRLFDDRRIGLIGCLLYTWAPYRIYDLYGRGEIGESMALCFLPLVVLGLCRAARRERWGWLMTALGFAGLAQTDLFQFFIAIGFTLIVCLVLRRKLFAGSFRGKGKELVLSAVLLACFVLPPLWRVLRHMMTETAYYAADPWVQHRGMYLIQYLTAFARGGTNVQIAETGTTDAAPRGVGFAVTITVLLWLWICFTGRYRETRRAQSGEMAALNRICRIGTGVGMTAMLLSLTVFPWDALRRLHWLTDKIISDLQTPACFVPMALIGFVIAACGALKMVTLSERKETAAVVLLVVAVTAFVTTQFLAGDLLNTREPVRETEQTETTAETPQ